MARERLYFRYLFLLWCLTSLYLGSLLLFVGIEPSEFSHTQTRTQVGHCQSKLFATKDKRFSDPLVLFSTVSVNRQVILAGDMQSLTKKKKLTLQCGDKYDGNFES